MISNHEAVKALPSIAQWLPASHNDVIVNLGIDNVEQIRKKASIAKSDAQREVAIAEAEKIEVSDEDFKAEVAEMAKAYGMEADELESRIGEYEKESIVSDLKVKKALEKTVEAAVEK